MNYESNVWKIIDAVGKFIHDECDENFTILAYMLLDNVIDENRFICALFSYIDEKYTRGVINRMLLAYKTFDSFDILALSVASFLLYSQQTRSQYTHEMIVAKEIQEIEHEMIHSLYDFYASKFNDYDWKVMDFIHVVDFMKNLIMNEHCFS